MNELKYEFATMSLVGESSKYINFSLPLVLRKDIDEKRIGAFAYLKMCSGVDDVSRFIVPNMVEWCGYKSASNKMEGTNTRFLNVLNELSECGYITFLTEKSRSKYMECRINEDHYSSECMEGYGTIYLDELKKILAYKRKDKDDVYIKNTIILLVFAYLRCKIAKRPNELFPEERSSDKIKDRKIRLPEAYDTTLSNIAKELRLSDRSVSVAINILELELGLIVTDTAYRVRNKNGEFRTPNTIFANAYKRENNYLLAAGEEYSRAEIENKANRLEKIYPSYKINKDKRKIKQTI